MNKPYRLTGFIFPVGWAYTNSAFLSVLKGSMEGMWTLPQHERRGHIQANSPLLAGDLGEVR